MVKKDRTGEESAAYRFGLSSAGARTDGLGARLESVRGSSSQKEFAQRLGVHKNTWTRYEREERLVDSETLLALQAFGFSATWVLSGIGPERLAELQPQQIGDWNPELLRQVIEAVETALDLSGREMDPPDKAQLILSIYDLYAESGASPSTAKIIKLVRTTA